jgi:hypothetical protein
MSYQKFMETVKSDEQNIWEEIGCWMGFSPSAKADIIREVKDSGNRNGISYLLSISEAANILSEEGALDPRSTIPSTLDAKDVAALKAAAKATKQTAGTAQEAGLKEKLAKGFKNATEKASETAKDVSNKIKDAGVSAGGALKKFAGEHGGKVAAATAAGLGALALVKAMRRKKATA